MDIKNELKIGIITSIILLVILVFFVFQYKKQLQSLNQISKNIPQTTNSQLANSTAPTQVTLSWEEIKKHNSPQDCWIVIAEAVYDATNYANLHPGGADLIYNFCGQDATTAFQTKGGKGSHSDKAIQTLSQLYIGKIGEKVNYTQKSVSDIKIKSKGKEREKNEDYANGEEFEND